MKTNYLNMFKKPQGGFSQNIKKFNPNETKILNITQKNEKEVNIEFYFTGIKGVRETIDGDERPTHFNLQVYFFGEIICKGIKKIDNISNFKNVNNIKLSIKNNTLFNSKKIILNENENKGVIQCKEIYFKDNNLLEFVKHKNGELIPFKH